MRPILVAALMLTMGGCVAPLPEPPPPAPPPSGGSCGAEALQTLVGGSARVLETMKFGGPVRIIRPGMAITMDYSPDRLNIEIDGAERIIRVTCG